MMNASKKEIVKLHIEGNSITDLSIEYKISPTSINRLSCTQNSE